MTSEPPVGAEVPDDAAGEVPDGAAGELSDGPDAGAAERAELRAACEAIMLVVDEPVTEAVLAEVLDQPVEQVTALLTELAAEYTAAGRGFELRQAAGGWRLYTRPALAPYVERFVLDGQQAKLTQAALETLAVVAYRQPVTRSRISAIRGVNCDGVIRTLLSRGLVEESGTEAETGAHLYRTTNVFLEKLGLDSLDELPPLAPLLPENVDALDPDARQPPEAARAEAALAEHIDAPDQPEAHSQAPTPDQPEAHSQAPTPDQPAAHSQERTADEPEYAMAPEHSDV